MKTYTYSDLDSFEQAMRDPAQLADMAKSVVAAIKDASSKQKIVADICSIGFEVEDSLESFQVRIPKKEWPNALLTSMKHMEVAGYVDEVIDTYVLHKELTQAQSTN